MKIKTSLLVILVLPMPAISAEHSDMKMGDVGSFTSSQAYMSGMNEVRKKMMAVVKEPGPDKAFAEGMIVHHEGAIAMAETGLKYGKGPGTRKLAEDTIKTQKDEIDQMSERLDNQK